MDLRNLNERARASDPEDVATRLSKRDLHAGLEVVRAHAMTRRSFSRDDYDRVRVTESLEIPTGLELEAACAGDWTRVLALAADRRVEPEPSRMTLRFIGGALTFVLGLITLGLLARDSSQFPLALGATGFVAGITFHVWKWWYWVLVGLALAAGLFF